MLMKEYLRMAIDSIRSNKMRALMTMLGSVLPPLLIISVISLFYQAFRDNAVVSMVMLGMQAGVAAVI